MKTKRFVNAMRVCVFFKFGLVFLLCLSLKTEKRVGSLVAVAVWQTRYEERNSHFFVFFIIKSLFAPNFFLTILIINK